MPLRITDNEFNRLVEYMYSKFGINLKQKRVLIEGRLNMLLTQRGYTCYNDYIDDLMKDRTGQEVSVVVSKLTTNFTYFLREEGHYDYLVKNVLPAWKEKGGPLKVWSAASSSGEEPYSLAMVISNFCGYLKPVNATILASDISDFVLKQARDGIYNEERTSKLPEAWVRRYFKKIGPDRFQVADEIKNMVTFKYFNLNDNLSWQRGVYDIVFCRNVMIYFDQPTKQLLTERIYDSIRPGGYLFIGMSETLVNLKTEFTYLQPSIYRKMN